jgi:hypothetical protein
LPLTFLKSFKMTPYNYTQWLLSWFFSIYSLCCWVLYEECLGLPSLSWKSLFGEFMLFNYLKWLIIFCKTFFIIDIFYFFINISKTHIILHIKNIVVFLSLFLNVCNKETCISEILLYRVEHAFGQSPFLLAEFVDKLVRF